MPDVGSGVGSFGQALELISNDVGPEEPAPSQGNKNPAVMKYDPTGLRTTMSTSDKAWEESLKVGVVVSARVSRVYLRGRGGSTKVVSIR